MKFAFCCEDKSDDDILHALTERVLDEVVERLPPSLVVRRSGGWLEAIRIAPKVARAVHRSEAHGAVFVVDNDGDDPHATAHTAAPSAKCRTCQLRNSAEVAEVLGWPRPGLPQLQFIFAVPVQVLETWLLLAAQRFPSNRQADAFGRSSSERRELKRLLYGKDRADRDARLRSALPIARSADVARLTAVSGSFGDFASQLREARSAVATSL